MRHSTTNREKSVAQCKTQKRGENFDHCDLNNVRRRQKQKHEQESIEKIGKMIFENDKIQKVDLKLNEMSRRSLFQSNQM
jgi:hypothetical protein